MPALEEGPSTGPSWLIIIAGLHPHPRRECVSSDFPRSPVSLTRSRGPWVPFKAPHSAPIDILRSSDTFPIASARGTSLRKHTDRYRALTGSPPPPRSAA